VQGSDDGTKVTVTAAGTIPAILPLVGSWSLPVRARASFSKESFVVGPGG
jgi:hypothetical protein